MPSGYTFYVILFEVKMIQLQVE